MQEMHDSPMAGHFGSERTFDQVARRFWWPALKTDVLHYCRTCPTCQKVKTDNRKPAGLLQPIPPPTAPWQQLTMDFLFNLPKSTEGYTGVVVWVDRFSKMIRVAPCKENITSEQMAQLFLTHVVRSHGVPASIISDRDPRIMGSFWKALTYALGTKLKPSTVQHPETDGLTERANRTILQLLRSYATADQRGWVQQLPLVEFSYNCSKNSSTGHAPFEVAYGSVPKQPSDLLLPQYQPAARDMAEQIAKVHRHVQQQMASASARMVAQANKHRRDVQYRRGDKVLLSSAVFLSGTPDKSRKLLRKYFGPFTVLHARSPVNVTLQLPPHVRIHNTVHVSKVKRWLPDKHWGRRQDMPPVDSEFGDDVLVFTPERVISKRGHGARLRYLVKYTGFDHCENQWLPKNELVGCEHLIRAFERREAARQP
jgi:hypothetical protein